MSDSNRSPGKIQKSTFSLPPSPPPSPPKVSKGAPAISATHVIQAFASADASRWTPTTAAIDDLAKLSHADEESIYQHLSTRFMRDCIYTYSGLFLIAINPWKNLGLYSEDNMKAYRGKSRSDMPPHLYAVCDEAYRKLLDTRRNQTILITGESGAGKTMNTTQVIEYFAKSSNGKQSLDEKLLHANPILEAFGNAQTVKNNNSSRFGKFIKLGFDAGGRIYGASIEHYLLEKGRVVNHDHAERSFHIFYALLNGAKDHVRKALLLKSAAEYEYLKAGAASSINNADDVERFAEVEKAMKIMGISDQQIEQVWSILSAILLMGNLKFGAHTDDESRVIIENPEVLSELTDILKIDAKSFENALTDPHVQVSNQTVRIAQTPAKAKFAIDALAKATYDHLFKWLAQQINSHLKTVQMHFNSFIGILDMSGFEIFERNSFEQLCINFTNEKLQQFYNHHTFIAEQELYTKEGIQWELIDFGLDLQPTIDLIEQSRGVMPILDEESIFPQATDDSFIQKLFDNQNNASRILNPVRFKPRSFTLKHYAGAVEYCATGWLAKNKDPLDDGLLAAMRESSIPLLKEVFSGATRKKGVHFITQSQHYQRQLSDLMKQLQMTDPHFVRCILPNSQKQALSFDKSLVMNQLKCNGVLEGIRIMRLGFSVRLDYSDFFRRFKIILPEAAENSRTWFEKEFLKRMRFSADLIQFGKTKIFMKQQALEDLDQRRNQKISRAISTFQIRFKNYLSQKREMTKLQRERSATLIQKFYRHHRLMGQDKWRILFQQVKPMLSALAQHSREKELQALVNSLKEDMQRGDEQASALQLENQRLRKTIVETNNLLAEMQMKQNEQAETSSAVRELEQQSAELKSQLARFDDEKSKLEHERKFIQSQLDIAENQISELCHQMEQLSNQSKANQEQLTDARLEIMQFESDADCLRNQNETLNKQVFDSTALIEKLKQECDMKDTEIATLKQSVAQYSSARVEQDSQYDQQVSRMKTALNQFEMELKMSRENESLLQQQLDISRSQLSESTQAYRSMEGSNEHLKRKIAELEQQLADVRHQFKQEQDLAHEEMEVERQQMRTLLQKTQHEMESNARSLQEKIVEEQSYSKSELTSLKSKLKSVSDEKASLTQKLAMTSDNAMSLEHRLTEALAKLKQAESRLITSQRSEKDLRASLDYFSSIEQERAELIREKNRLQTELQLTERRLLDSQRQIDASESENFELLAKMEAAKLSENSLTNQYRALQLREQEQSSSYAQCVQELDSIKIQLAQALTQSDSDRNEIQRLRFQCKELEKKLWIANEELCGIRDTSLPSLTAERDSLSQRVKDLQASFEEVDLKYVQQNAMIGKLHDQIESLRENERLLIAAHELALNDLHHASEAEKSRLRHELKESQNLKTKYFEQIQQLSVKFDSLKEEKLQMIAKENDVEVARRQMEMTIHDLSLQLSQKSATLDSNIAFQKQLSSRIDNLTAKLSESENIARAAEQQMMSMTAELKFAREELLQVRSHDEQKTAAITKLKKVSQDLESQLTQKKQEIDGLQKRIRAAVFEQQSRTQQLSDQYRSDISKLKSDMTDISQDLEKTKSELHAKTMDVMTFESRLNSAQNELNATKAASAEIEVKWRQAAQRNHETDLKYSQLLHENKETIAAMERLSTQKNELESRCQQMSNRLEFLEKETHDLERSKTENKLQISSLVLETANLKEKQKTSIEELKDLQMRYEQLHAQKITMEAQNAEHQAIILHLEQTKNDLELCIKQDEEKKADRISHLTTEVERLENVVRALTTQLESTTTDERQKICQLENDLFDCKESIAQLKAQNRQLKQFSTQQLNDTKDIERQFQIAQTQLLQKTGLNTEMKTLIDNLNIENRKLACENHESKMAIEELQRQIKLLCQELAILAQKHEETTTKMKHNLAIQRTYEREKDCHLAEMERLKKQNTVICNLLESSRNSLEMEKEKTVQLQKQNDLFQNQIGDLNSLYEELKHRKAGDEQLLLDQHASETARLQRRINSLEVQLKSISQKLWTESTYFATETASDVLTAETDAIHKIPARDTSLDISHE